MHLFMIFILIYDMKLYLINKYKKILYFVVFLSVAFKTISPTIKAVEIALARSQQLL